MQPLCYRAGDVRVQNVPDAKIEKPDRRSCAHNPSLHLRQRSLAVQRSTPDSEWAAYGHEAIGVVEAVGAGVRKVKKGDFVVMPFAFSDGSCDFCHEGLQASCVHGGYFGFSEGVGGAQAEAIRLPFADGTLYALPVRKDNSLVASLLTLSDVMGTGHHAAVTAGVTRGRKVAVVGDGAVGLCGVIAAKRLGAEQIILLGRHPDRIALAKEFGATDIVSERGEEAVARA